MDDRERGFNRLVEVDREGEGYRAILRYERVEVHGAQADTPTTAVRQLVGTLQARSYTQMRSRLSFRGHEYLGSQEPWIEYPDPEPPRSRLAGLIGRLRRMIERVRS